MAGALGCRSPRGPAQPPDSGVADGAEVGLASDSGDPQPSTGLELYLSRCIYCHGADARGTPDGPDLAPILAERRPVRLSRSVVEGVGDMPPIDITRPEARRALRHAEGLIATR
jgi:mono/diheme cytochrome c family protein